jgi:hypothetical protein
MLVIDFTTPLEVQLESLSFVFELTYWTGVSMK